MQYDIHSLAREIDRNFKKFEGAINQNGRAINELNYKLAQFALEKSAQEFRVFLSEYYKNINSYYNILIVAGYAVIFGVWRFERDAIPNEVSFLIGFLTIISASIFTIWQIFFLKKQYKAFEDLEEIFDFDMSDPKHAQQIQEKITKIKEKSHSDIIKTRRVGKITHHGALWPALAAAAILCVTFIWRLAQNAF